MRCKLHQSPHAERKHAGNQQIIPDDFFHAAGPPRAVVEAQDRLPALRQPQQRHLHHLRDRGQNGHCADGEVAAILLQGDVERHGQQAFSGLHDKRRRAQRNRRHQQLTVKPEELPAQPQGTLLPVQELDHPQRGDRLRNDGRNRRAAHAHAEQEDKYRVEHDVEHCADQHGFHCNAGLSLRGDKAVEAERGHHEDRTQHIDIQILHRIGQRIRRRAEQHEQRLLEQQEQHGQHNRKAPQRGGAGAERALGLFVLTRTHGDGCTGRASHADQ